MTKLLDEAIATLRDLAERDQDVAAKLLLAFCNPEAVRYQLSDDQVAEVELAKREVREGKIATDAEMNDVHHERLPPGRRSSYPHAESAEEEFVYVIEGTPDVWLDGRLHRLRPGDAVGFPAGTGITHSFLNNTETEVRLLVVGETSKPDNRIYYPRNPERKAQIEDWWDDVPQRALGDHDGLTDARRAATAKRTP